MASIEENVDQYRSFICRCIREPMVVSHLSTVLTPDDSSRVKSVFLDQQQPHLGIEELIIRVQRSRNPGKWKAFVDAIRKADYPYLADLLENKQNQRGEYERKMIQVFSSELEKQLLVTDVITELYSYDVITDIDRESVMATLQQKGNTYATMVLLDKMQCRKSPKVWYREFLKILRRKGYHGLVKAIEPDLLPSSSPYASAQDFSSPTCLYKRHGNTYALSGSVREHVLSDYKDSSSPGPSGNMAAPQPQYRHDMAEAFSAIKVRPHQRSDKVPKSARNRPSYPRRTVHEDISDAVPTRNSLQQRNVQAEKGCSSQGSASAQKSSSASSISGIASKADFYYDEKYYLGDNKYVQLSQWKSEKRVDIRVWKGGVPTKQGINISSRQWSKLVDSMKHLDKALSRQNSYEHHLGENVYCLIEESCMRVDIQKYDKADGTKKEIRLGIDEYARLKDFAPKIGTLLS